MTDSFLSTFMKAAQKITRTERSMAINAAFEVIAADHLNQTTVESAAFRDVAMSCLKRALTHGESIITNNIITDPTQAPKTNTNFSHLRIVVVMPVADFGAVYLDQHVRYGVVSKDVVDRLMAFIQHLITNELTDLDAEQMVTLFHELN